MNDHFTSEGSSCAAAFDAAGRDTHKAWTQTALLGQVNAERVIEARQALSSADPVAISKLLVDLVGQTFEGHEIRTEGALPAAKMKSMAGIVLKLLASHVLRDGCREPVEVVVRLSDAARTWIEFGAVGGQPYGQHNLDQLARIAELMGGDARLRLALLAPFSPALMGCTVVLRASQSSYPFREGGKP